MHGRRLSCLSSLLLPYPPTKVFSIQPFTGSHHDIIVCPFLLCSSQKLQLVNTLLWLGHQELTPQSSPLPLEEDFFFFLWVTQSNPRIRGLCEVGLELYMTQGCPQLASQDNHVGRTTKLLSIVFTAYRQSHQVIRILSVWRDAQLELKFRS